MDKRKQIELEKRILTDSIRHAVLINCLDQNSTVMIGLFKQKEKYAFNRMKKSTDLFLKQTVKGVDQTFIDTMDEWSGALLTFLDAIVVGDDLGELDKRLNAFNEYYKEIYKDGKVWKKEDINVKQE